MKAFLRKGMAVFSAIAVWGIGSLHAEDNAQGSSKGEFSKVGAAGSQFLKIGTGARGAAMGGAMSAYTNDVASVYWNPAGIAEAKSYVGEFNYTQWFADFSHQFAGVVFPIGNYRAALSFTTFSSGNIPYTTIEQPEGTGAFYTVSDVAMTGTFGGYITEEFTFGASFKYVSNAFARLNSGGVAFDVGTKYISGWKGVTVGFAVSNLGGQLSYTGQDLNLTRSLSDGLYAAPIDVQILTTPYNIPLAFRAGFGADVMSIVTDEGIAEDAEHKWLAGVDFISQSDASEQIAIGTEYTWSNIISLRGGYTLGNAVFGLSGGIGLRYLTDGFDGRIDYSLNVADSRIGLINRISIGVGLK